MPLSADPASSPAPLAPCCVSVIEDDDALRSALTFSFELEGFRVLAFPSGREALAARCGAQCCCFVIDYRLPDMDGLALIARLRAAGTSASAILVTTNPTARLQSEAARVGVRIVEKPLLGDKLMLAVRDFAGACRDDGRPCPHG